MIRIFDKNIEKHSYDNFLVIAFFKILDPEILQL